MAGMPAERLDSGAFSHMLTDVTLLLEHVKQRFRVRAIAGREALAMECTESDPLFLQLPISLLRHALSK